MYIYYVHILFCVYIIFILCIYHVYLCMYVYIYIYVCIRWNLPPPSHRTHVVHVSEGLSTTVSLVLQAVGGWGQDSNLIVYRSYKVTTFRSTCTDLINMLDDCAA